MIDFIYNNYGIKIDKLYKNKNQLFFFINNKKIIILKEKELRDNIDYLLKISNYLNDSGFKVNSIILNKNHKSYTPINEYYIILMQINDIEYSPSLEYIIKFENIKTNLLNYNIYEEWTKEVDIIEKEIIEYNKEFLLLQRYIDYYIGMAENAIELISNYESIININNDSIGHIVDFNIYDNNVINNPFTFVNINKMYDFANYIKYMFYKNELDYMEIDNYIVKANEYEKTFLFSCLLYPNDIFSLMKKILIGEEKEEKLQFYIQNIKNYNKLLILIKDYLSNIESISYISWISE